MSITMHHTIEQGSPEWLALRCGILTASDVKLILTPTLKIASNEKERSHLYELLAQRVTGHVEPQYISDDMLRGHEDEITARALYAENYAPVEQVGFITNDSLGFTLGYSPDGLVGSDGIIEIKSRCQKYQMQTILDGAAPADYMLQLQTGLLVTGRSWIDFCSFSAGMPFFVRRVFPDAKIQAAILEAATTFEARLDNAMLRYQGAVANGGFVKTERQDVQEIY